MSMDKRCSGRKRKGQTRYFYLSADFCEWKPRVQIQTLEHDTWKVHYLGTLGECVALPPSLPLGG